MSELSAQNTNAPTKIVEVTDAVKEFIAQEERKPTVADLEQKYPREDDVCEDTSEALGEKCLEKDANGRLSVTPKGDDYVTGKVYPATEIFECKSNANRFERGEDK